MRGDFSFIYFVLVCSVASCIALIVCTHSIGRLSSAVSEDGLYSYSTG